MAIEIDDVNVQANGSGRKLFEDILTRFALSITAGFVGCYFESNSLKIFIKFLRDRE